MNINSKRCIFLLILVLTFFCTLSAKNVSPATNMLKSAIFPGWGELSVGHKSGYTLMAAEIILWSAKYYYLEESDFKETASFKYAIKYAHINPSKDYDESYFGHLKKYTSSGYEAGGYNAHILAEAEKIEDPVAREEYIQNNIYSDEYYWNWDNKDKKKQYGVLRKRILQYSDYVQVFTGVIIANHIFSAIHSMRISSKLKRLEFKVGFDKDLNPGLFCRYQF